MSSKKWIGCGSSYPRLELLATILPGEGANNEPPTPGSDRVVSFSGLRIAVAEDAAEFDAAAPTFFNLVRVHEVTLPVSLSLNWPENFFSSIPDESLGAFVFEGLENPTERLLSLVSVSGWRLVFKKNLEGELCYQLILRSDWGLSTLPGWLPGFSQGESVIYGKILPTPLPEASLRIEVAWPFTLNNRLKLQRPTWSGTRWCANLDVSTFDSLLDGAGDLLSKFPVGHIDVADIVKKAGSAIDDYIFFNAGTEPIPALVSVAGNTQGDNAADTHETTVVPGDLPANNPTQVPTGTGNRDYFEIELTTPEATPIASFAGLKLMLIGRLALAMKAAFEQKHMDLEFLLKFGSVISEVPGEHEFVGLKLTGGIITRVTDMWESVREVASLLPMEGINDLPEIEFVYEFDFLRDRLHLNDNYALSLGKLKIPTAPDFLPDLMPSIGFLKNLPLSVPQKTLDKLKNFKLGGLDGDSPAMEMIIENVANFQQGNAVGIRMKLRIGFKIFDEVIKLVCDWVMTFDKETLSFSPAAHLEVTMDLDKPYVDFKGFRIEGLETLRAKWGAGGIELSAHNLKAYYVALSSPDDPSSGFEFNVHTFLLDSGGLDLEANLTGGSPTLDGIGDCFKAVAGHVSIVRSQLNSASIKAEGPLPWMDNATGTLSVLFGSDFTPREVKADFQLNIHKKTDWWLELDLKGIKIDLDFSSGKPRLLMKITGKIALKPPPGAGDSFLSFMQSAELEFTDLLLTKSFDGLPPGLSLTVALSKPLTKDIFGVFGFEIRSIGICSGFERGQAALSIGGQVFFSSGDLVSTDLEFHKLKIGAPPRGSFIPRVSLERLSLNFSVASTVKVTGRLSLADTELRKGFVGAGRILIADRIGIQVILEFSKVTRGDGKQLRVWMVYADWEDIDTQLVFGFYLRDVGIGFGWRKTLTIMDNPRILLQDPSKSNASIGPHKPESWVDDLEGDSARWTVVLASWLTYGVDPRTSISPLVGDIILGIRSDLTFLMSMRGWIFASLDKIKNGPASAKPALQGLLYYSARNQHLLAAYIVNPTAMSPGGVPPAIAQALIKKPFSFVLETKPGLLRIELGWPTQLTFPVGIYTGRAGILLRKAPGALTIGVAFELSIDKTLSLGFDFGIGSLSIYIQIYIGIYGIILMRIGDRAALYGVVGINALVIISMVLSVNFKIGWFRIRFSLDYSITIVINARVDFGISNAGFGMSGYAYASLRIWKFSVSAQVSFVINQGALDEAYKRVTEGTSGLPPLTGLGDEAEVLREIPLLPQTRLPLPALPPEKPTWRTFFIKRDEIVDNATVAYVYVLLLPESDSWFANPQPNAEKTASALFAATDDSPDYRFSFSLENLQPDFASPDAIAEMEGNTYRVEHRVNWNLPLPDAQQTTSDSASVHKKNLGSFFYEPEPLKHAYRVIDNAIANQQPELIVDERVRAGEQPEEVAMNSGYRSDVRSPKFSEEASLYDTVNEAAFKNGKDEMLSWQQIALAHYNWEPVFLNHPPILNYLFDDATKPTEPPLEKIAHDHWRKKLLDAAEMVRGNRGGVMAKLLQEFRDWAFGRPLKEVPTICHSGVAFRFKVTDSKEPFRLSVNEMEAFQGFDDEGKRVVHHMREYNVVGGTITESDSGLGFAKKEYDYKIKDIIEFQDKEGIHFSWRLECRDANNRIALMSEPDLCHVGTPAQLQNIDLFEFFDHFLIERINLTNNETAHGIIRREVKPGFVPALVDMGGDGEKKFYLVAPRFSYSDPLASPQEKTDTVHQEVKPGDELLYRLMAVDVFGNRSQVTELITSRKNLEIPPAPKKGIVTYEVEFLPVADPLEKIGLQVEEDTNESTWNGGELIYEFWTRSRAITAGGYFGVSDVSNDTDAPGDNGPVVSPKGMVLVGRIDSKSIAWVTQEGINNITIGEALEFYVRSVSKEGNASRLIHCDITTLVRKSDSSVMKEFKLSHLERIPGYSTNSSSWLTLDQIRTEVCAAGFPCYSQNLLDPITSLNALAPSERELFFRILHERFIDAGRRYLTGGYELFMRDRDNTFEEVWANYRKVGQVEIVSPEVYRSTPPNTMNDSKWVSHFLSSVEKSASEEVKNRKGKPYLDWGEYFPLFDGTEGNGLPDATLVHHRLFELIVELRSFCQIKKYEMVITGGLTTAKAFENITFDRLLELFHADEDPKGIKFIGWLGRSVEISILGSDGPIPLAELHDAIQNIIKTNSVTSHWNLYTVNIDLLVNGDKTTAMNFFRLNLLPVIKFASEETEATLLASAFEGLKNILLRFPTLNNYSKVPGADGKSAEYEFFSQKYFNHHALSGERRLVISVTHFLDQGDYIRPIKKDNTILFHLAYKEEYARRYTFRIRRVSRYDSLYSLLGFTNDAYRSDVAAGDAIMVRFPRVKPPAKPASKFLGNSMEGNMLYSSWFVAEHDEEPMVRANETARNRLGYRGIAWSLFVNTLPGFEEGSGWKGEKNWLSNTEEFIADHIPGLTFSERKTISSEASWKDESGLSALAGLQQHPFTELLGPKGITIRVPKLPYYYRYRLGTFARTDDVDSDVALIDAAPAMPSVAPQPKATTAGWALDGNRLSIWWRIPSVWDSLDPTEKMMWKNEQPFASRLWDFDVRYSLSIFRNACRVPQLEIKPLPWDPSQIENNTNRRFEVLTTGKDIHFNLPGKIEKRNTRVLTSPFDPLLRLEVMVSDQLAGIIRFEERFEFILKAFRTYGENRFTNTPLRRKTKPT